MWIRVTCPNGHSLKIDTRYIGRKNRCPKCQAHIALWLEVVCASCQTSLKVKSMHAGKTGKCPKCRSLVDVPDITEALALDILGGVDAIPRPAEEEEYDEGVLSGSDPSDSSASGIFGGSSSARRQRECPSCNARIALAFRTCPKCGKYIGETDTSGSMVNKVRKCPECAAVGFPGDEFCGNCGTPFL